MSFSRQTRGRHLPSDLINPILQIEGRTGMPACEMGPGARKLLHNKPSTHFLCDNYFREGFLSIPPNLSTRPSRDLHKNGRLLSSRG